MGLRYLLVASESERSYFKGSRPEVLFVVHPDEELKILSAIGSAPRKLKLVFSKPLEGTANHLELAKLLRADRRLGVSALPINCKEITTAILNGHLRGVRITDFEAALLELNPSIASTPEAIVRLVTKGGLHQNNGVRVYLRVKQVLEPVVAALLLFVLSPLLMLVAALVKLTSSGPIFYGQERLGLHGKEFKIMKFRSMRTDAEKHGPVWASANAKDSRLSPVGGFLRGTHLDELPQFWNILCGHISFIGPRPERKCFSDQLEKTIPTFALRTMVKPGITGWAQTRQGYANSADDSRTKLELDLYYIVKHSPRLDAVIVLKTLGLLVSGGTEGKKRSLAGIPSGAVTKRTFSSKLPSSGALAVKRYHDASFSRRPVAKVNYLSANIS